MTDNELLLAISNALEPVREDIREIKGDIQGIKGDIQEIKVKIQGMEGEIQEIKVKIQGMEGDIQEIKGRVTRLETIQENEIKPRLQNIEACYISTYERYKDSIDGYEAMKEDISTFKNVVAGHSEKLKRIG